MIKSESIQNLIPDLVAFRNSVTNPPRDAVNPHFRSRYTKLSTLIEHLAPILAAHGLAVVQLVGELNVTTLMFHKSGEYFGEITPLVLDKQSMQAQGSAITYARRYGMEAITGVASQDDDDANAVSQPEASSNIVDPFDL
jgi:hypothetical protein